MSEIKLKEKWFIAKNPGYCISLPDGLMLDTKVGGVTKSTGVIKFPTNGGRMFKTSDPKIIEFLLSTPAFRMEKITLVPTPEEVAFEEKRSEQAKNLTTYRGLVEKGIPLNFKEMSDTNVRQVADEIGAETSGDGKKLTKAAIVANIDALISPVEVSG